MQLNIAKRDLSGALKNVARAVERRNTIPILANALLEARDNVLSIKGTDLDLEIAATVACEVKQDGQTTVPALMLNSIVDKIKPDDAEITLSMMDDKILSLQAKRSRFKLQVLPECDFPRLDMGELPTEFELPVGDMTKILAGAEFCISTEETRYYLNGIYLHLHKEGKTQSLRGVSTDGHRLARIDVDAPGGLDNFNSVSNATGVIVPRKTIKLLATLLKDSKADKIGVRASQTKIIFDIGGTTLASKLIDGTFPDYARVVPAGNDKRVRLDRTELADAVDRLSTVSTERGRSAKFNLTTGQLILTVVNPDAGSATEELDVDYTGDALEIGFNTAYMNEILSHVTGDQVELSLADPGSPAIITGVDKPGALFVQMPMRV